MDFKDLYQIKNEAERVSKTYDIFDEDTRLSTSKAGRVEFLTTARAIMQVVKPRDRILDIGAGTGVYSFYLAEQGCQVDAVELADRNVEVFREKLSRSPYAAGVGQNTAVQKVEKEIEIEAEREIDIEVKKGIGIEAERETRRETEKNGEKILGGSIRLRQGNALDLSAYEEESFDAVLLFGPLYHLSRAEDRQRCIAEAKRVCKKDGTLFFAFISNDMVILTEFGYDADYFKGNSYDHETFKVEDFPFVFFTLDQCRQMLQEGGISIQREIASDGVSELLADRINQMDEESYQQYLRYHFYCCEKPEMLGRSNHLLFVGKKMQRTGSVNNIEKLPFEVRTKERLTILVNMLSQLPQIQRIILFGSYARMEQKTGSDLDILALTLEELPRELRGELHSKFDENKADLIFYTEEQFMASECALVKNIRRDGVLLWEA